MADCYPHSEDGACNENPPFQYCHSDIAATDGNPFALHQVDPTSPHLYVSNAPEMIGGNGHTVTTWAHLYKAKIPLSASQRIRIFFWHLNEYTDGETRFSIRISLDGGATISNMKRKTLIGRFKDITSKGMCLADRQLYGKLTAVSGTMTIPSNGELDFWTGIAETAATGYLSIVAGIFEFDVGDFINDEDPHNLFIRTVASRNGQFGTFGTYGQGANYVEDAVAPAGAHVRGWWPYSRATFKLSGDPVFNCATVGGATTPLQGGVCENFGGEFGSNNEAFGDRTGNPDPDIHGKANKGCYGADLRYVMKAKAVGGAGNVYVTLLARNPGGKFAGAGRLVAPSQLGETCIPKFKCTTGTLGEGYWNSFDFLESIEPTHRIELSTNEETTVEIDLAVAGAAATPVNIVLSKDGIIAVRDDPTGEGS